MNPYWSYILAAVSVFGLWLAGRKSKTGWAVGFGSQFLWATYGVVTEQWGFALSAIPFAWVQGRNYLAWSKTEKETVDA